MNLKHCSEYVTLKYTKQFACLLFCVGVELGSCSEDGTRTGGAENGVGGGTPAWHEVEEETENRDNYVMRSFVICT
jgi:hypothetical protein